MRWTDQTKAAVDDLLYERTKKPNEGRTKDQGEGL